MFVCAIYVSNRIRVDAAAPQLRGNFFRGFFSKIFELVSRYQFYMFENIRYT